MSSRYVPYARTPGRLFAQLTSDVVAVVWFAIWVSVGVAVHHAIATIADVGRQLHDGAGGVAHSLSSAGHNADGIPLIGKAFGAPLRSAGSAATDIAGAGDSLNSTASWLAWVLALAVALPPILAVAMPWLVLRIRFFRRKWTAVTLASTDAGEQLLAFRALANRPLAKLTEVSDDPVTAWRSHDTIAIRKLAALELRSAGLRPARPETS
ncbi:hypothetical protein BOO86_07390 [Mycobacterium sp. CBMA 234]|uniref:hypothetical protein n=1 Tax=Mycolicibacterium sp. CBMA 234 TaxID=1918495 RepID=UPI0012DF403F|nr:hypothetical protein [Mycolicibacterium sp. CBMA 234]MUL64282.1 hypothetical protein [Mycolicibacterium sp. CBMA 234]